tara:strand:+ start:1135 stop:2073 length:939 start_codon:yes stop_codon:yes gene_type:complete
MSNGFNNPYKSGPIDLEDLILRGDVQRITSKKKRGSAGQGKWEYTYGYDPYSASLKDLRGLSADEIARISSLLPEGIQTYDYSGLGHIALDALDKVFGDYVLDVGDVKSGYGDAWGWYDADHVEGGRIFVNPDDYLTALKDVGAVSDDPTDYQYTTQAKPWEDVAIETGGPQLSTATLGIAGPSSIDFFDPDSIANALNVIGGFEEGAGIDPSEVTALNPDVIERQEDAYYEPVLEDVRETSAYTLLDSLAKDLTGGLAATAIPQAQKRRAKSQYKSSIGKILESIIKQKASASKDLASQIMGYKELLEEHS